MYVCVAIILYDCCSGRIASYICQPPETRARAREREPCHTDPNDCANQIDHGCICPEISSRYILKWGPDLLDGSDLPDESDLSYGSFLGICSRDLICDRDPIYGRV